MSDLEAAPPWTVDLAGARPAGRWRAAYRTAHIAEWIAATTPFSVPVSNPEALRAYYAGVFALVPVIGPLLAGGALTWGPLGLRAARRGDGGAAHARAGIALAAVSLAVHAAAAVWLTVF
jgi:hypothetical protein